MKNIDIPYNPIYPNLSCISRCNLFYRLSNFMLCVAVVFSTGSDHEFIASSPFAASESLYFLIEMATNLLWNIYLQEHQWSVGQCLWCIEWTLWRLWMLKQIDIEVEISHGLIIKYLSEEEKLYKASLFLFTRSKHNVIL